MAATRSSTTSRRPSSPIRRHHIRDLANVLDDLVDLAEKLPDVFVLYHVRARRRGEAPADAVAVPRPAMFAVVEGVGALTHPVELAYPAPHPPRLEKKGDRLPVVANIERSNQSTGALAVLTGEEIYEGLRGTIDAADRVVAALERFEQDRATTTSAAAPRAALVVTALGPGGMGLAAGSSISRSRPGTRTWNTPRPTDRDHRTGHRQHRAASSAG